MRIAGLGTSAPHIAVPDFLREIERRHAEHRSAGRSPTATLAREEGVAPTTVKHWLRRAKELGMESD
jgi:hypothetical protein